MDVMLPLPARLSSASLERPVHFDSPISLRTRLVRPLLILLVLAALASQLGPWGGALRQEVATRIDQVAAEGPRRPSGQWVDAGRAWRPYPSQALDR